MVRAAGTFVTAMFFAAAIAKEPLPLVLVSDVPLAGDTSRFDYESYDASRHLLFIAHLGQSEVLVFDTTTNKVVVRIPGIRHVHGVLAVPELGLVYASATGTDEVVAIDEVEMKIVARMPAGGYPDGMAYAPAARKLYVSDEHGDTETVIDVRTNRRVATIALEGDVGNTQFDSASGHIFVNVQSRRQLVEIDPLTDKIIARTDLPGAQGNHGLLIDSDRHRAFIACEDNDRLLVVDLQTRTIVQTLPVGHEPDVLAYDPDYETLYVASESGTVSMLRLKSNRVVARFEGVLDENAHVVAVDPKSHLVYFPLRDVGGHPVLRIVRPRN
jgi:YVTN family beta-propeller protein